MAHRSPLLLAALLVLAGPASALAQDGSSCLLDGRRYPENAVVCSGGLVMYCSNGTWQSNDGQRCDARSGAYVSPLRPFAERNTEPIPEEYLEQYPWLRAR
ncbi:MAG TPA: hypothetical protein VIS07_19190 [Candidatus Binatia bacterium]